MLKAQSQADPILVYEGPSPHQSFILLLCLYVVQCGGRETQFALVLQRDFVFKLLLAPSFSPGKSVRMVQNQSRNCFYLGVSVE